MKLWAELVESNYAAAMEFTGKPAGGIVVSRQPPAATPLWFTAESTPRPSSIILAASAEPDGATSISPFLLQWKICSEAPSCSLRLSQAERSSPNFLPSLYSCKGNCVVACLISHHLSGFLGLKIDTVAENKWPQPYLLWMKAHCFMNRNIHQFQNHYNYWNSPHKFSVGY